jgi:hypothetical protein
MRQGLLLAMLMGILLGAGCERDLPVQIPGITGDRIRDEERVAVVLDDVARGMESKRIYRVLSHVSKEYRDQEGRDYAAIRDYLADVMKRYRQIRITRMPPKIVVQGDKARAIESFGTQAEPADSRADAPLNVQGQVSVYLERVDGAWQIVEWGPLW